MDGWRFIDTGTRDGPTNMAIDRALLEGIERRTSPPTIRVYAWAPPTVSVGYGQDASKELDLARCARDGVGVVRRPTGGRAVLHAGELTYSVAGPSGVPPLGDSIMTSYRAVARALVGGLEVLGVDAELAPVPTRPSRTRRCASPPCFASAGRFEILVGGKKLVGSAQRRGEGSVLQHGSLLIDGAHRGICDLARLGNEKHRERLRLSLASSTTDLESILGRPVCFAEVARAIRLGFAEAWRTEVTEGVLSNDENEAAKRHATEYAVRG